MPPFLCHCTNKFITAIVLMTVFYCCNAMAQEAQDQDSPVLTIGTISGQIAETATPAPFEDYLENKLGNYQIQVREFEDIEAMMRAVSNQDLDFAFITPVVFVELSQNLELRPISTILQRAGDDYSPWLAGAVFTLESRADINAINEITDTSVIALSEFALGGWLSAVREWKELGINEEDLNVTFDFSYASVIERVCSGEFALGVIAANTFDSYTQYCDQPLKVVSHHDAQQDNHFPLEHSTRLYPEVAFAEVIPHDESLVRNLTRALLDIEPGSEVASVMNVQGFTAPLSYREVQLLMQELELGPYANTPGIDLQQFLDENITVVTIILLGIVALTSAGFINAHILSRKFKDSEQFRKQIFEGSHVATIVVKPESGEFMDMNQSAIDLYGYSTKEELIGKTIEDVSAEGQFIRNPFTEYYKRIREKVMSEGNASFEWRHKRPNDEEWIGKVRLMKFNTSTGPLIQSMVEDITEQKTMELERRQLEQQLEFSQRMESIGRLAGSIAHDFNNLLTIINGYSEYMLDDSKDNPQQLEILSQINKAGVRASELTQQLLTFSRKQVIKQSPVNVEDMIRESTEMMSSALGEEIKLELDLKSSKSFVKTDPGQIQQIIINLIMNAKDAMPDGGKLKISTDTLFLNPQNARQLDLNVGEYLEILVSDNGTGMDENVITHIFEPFFTTKANTGTGLGLSTVYGIVRQTLGNIIVDSTKGEGTTFRILLPLTDEMMAEVEKEKVQVNFPNKEYTILVVEDQEEVRAYIHSVLDRAGFSTITAESGPEALAVMSARKDPVDLLLTDVIMEEMSGGELAEKFLKIYPDTPVLFTSGYPEDEIARHGVRQGTMEFLAKPFSPKDLMVRLNEILSDAEPVG